MNYREALDFTRKNNISILDITVACECDCAFEFDYTDEQFERLCEVAKNAVLKGERNIDEYAVATAINYLIVDDGKSIEDVINMIAWDIVGVALSFI